MAKPPFPFKPCGHLHVEAFFQVCFPGWVVRIGFSADFRVPLNADRRSREQSNHFHLPVLTIEDARENPAIGSFVGKVLILHPSARFTSMSAACPFPDG